jgi:hypothetical protein
MNEEVPSRGLFVLFFVAAIKMVGEAAGDDSTFHSSSITGAHKTAITNFPTQRFF